MTRYIYIDDSYKNAYLRNSSMEQRITMNAVATFMAAPETENEKGVDKKIIIKGVTRAEYKEYIDSLRKDLSEQDRQNDSYEQWMEYITRSCSQGVTTTVEFDEENNQEDIAFFGKLVKDEEIDSSKLNNQYWMSYCLCDKSSKECETLEHKYGISFIGVDNNITKHEPDATFIVMDEAYDWNTMIGNKSSNTIFVLDQYVFHKEPMMEANIITILKQLVSTKTDTQISIFTHRNLCYNKNDATYLSDLEHRIKTDLNSINPSAVACVANTCDYFHDRIIVTNNYYITIGGGFDALKTSSVPGGRQTSCKNTTLHIYANPAISSKDWLRNEYFGYINAISKKQDDLNQNAIRRGQPTLMANRLVRPI